MHVSGTTADKTLVNLALSGQLVARIAVSCITDSMQHKPRGLLSNSQRPVNLPRTDAVLAVGNEPHRNKPFVETERGILKDRARLNCELALCVMAAALPTIMLLRKRDFGASACGAAYAIGPAALDNVFAASN